MVVGRESWVGNNDNGAGERRGLAVHVECVRFVQGEACVHAGRGNGGQSKGGELAVERGHNGRRVRERK